jgi:cold shock CspA family protein
VIGHVVNLNVERGFFFLRVENEKEQSTTDYFAHRSDLRGVRVRALKEGDALDFIPQDTDRGPRATQIWPAFVEETADA